MFICILLTVDEFIANRDMYLKDGRAFEGDAVQKLAGRKRSKIKLMNFVKKVYHIKRQNKKLKSG